MQDTLLPTTSALPVPVPGNSEPRQIRLSEIISALSYALDLTEGQPMGHSVRTCIIGMRIAGGNRSANRSAKRALLRAAVEGRGVQQQFFAAISHHLCRRYSRQGRSENIRLDARRMGELALRDHPCGHRDAISRPSAKSAERCGDTAGGFEGAGSDSLRAGASIARKMSFPEPVGRAFSVSTSTGMEAGIQKVCAAADSAVFPNHEPGADAGCFSGESRGRRGLQAAQHRSGRWFDPDLVRATLSLAKPGQLWKDLDRAENLEQAIAL